MWAAGVASPPTYFYLVAIDTVLCCVWSEFNIGVFRIPF